LVLDAGADDDLCDEEIDDDDDDDDDDDCSLEDVNCSSSN